MNLSLESLSTLVGKTYRSRSGLFGGHDAVSFRVGAVKRNRETGTIFCRPERGGAWHPLVNAVVE